MHGNTESTSNGYKTRRFDNIRSEIEQSFDIHAAAGTRLGGVHLELTGEDVTECTGGARALTEVDLERAYRSTVDPRLNYEQALNVDSDRTQASQLNPRAGGGGEVGFHRVASIDSTDSRKTAAAGPPSGGFRGL